MVVDDMNNPIPVLCGARRTSGLLSAPANLTVSVTIARMPDKKIKIKAPRKGNTEDA
jgi:hypothetical protein